MISSARTMMEFETFPELISGRKFDLYQDGLRSRWRSWRIEYHLTYGDPTPKPALWMDFTTDEALARVTLWESGECDMEVLDAESGTDLLREHHEFSSSAEFFETYPKVPIFLRQHRGDAWPRTDKS